MPIVITRVGDLYEGTITPPHAGDSRWSSVQPMTADSLIEELRNLGCHQTDIGDAFYAADPEWVGR